MPNFDFKELSTSARKPGSYLELNTRNGVRGLPGNPQSIVIIAQKLAAGTLAQLVPTQVFSSEEAAIYAGYGSTAHGMVLAALRANRYIDLSICLLDDAAASVARVLTDTISGPATGPGVAVLDINNVQIEVAVATDDTATQIADAIVAKAADFPALPYTMANLAGVITLTARNTGTTHNQDVITFTTTAAGIAGVIAETVPGAVDPDIQDALDAIFPANFDLIVMPYNASADVQLLRDHLNTVSNGIEMRPGRGIVAVTGAVAAAVTVADAVNSGRVNLLNYRGSNSAAWQLAAAAVAAEAKFEDPALPRRDMPLAGLHAAPLAQLFSRTEEEAMLASGVTPVNVGPGEVVQIVRHISTYTTNPQNVSDPALLDTSTIATLDYGREAIRQRWSRDFSDKKATERTVDAVRSATLDVMKRLEDAEIWENIDANLDALVIQRDPNEPTRFQAKIPADVVNGLHQIYGIVDLIL